MITAQASYGVAGSDVSATLVGSLPNGYNKYIYDMDFKKYTIQDEKNAERECICN